MKFKCIINDYSKMKELLSLITTLQKQNERIAIITRNESMTLTGPKDSHKPLLFFDINAESFFDVYRMEGICPENTEDDTIYFEVNATNLISALGNMKQIVNFIEIKLSKEDFPFFTINMTVQTKLDQEKNVIISNKVPVIIVPSIGYDDFDLPYGASYFQAETVIPRFSTFKRYIDTFKNASRVRFVLRKDSLSIEANDDVSRYFSIFKDLKVYEFGSNPQNFYGGSSISALVEQKQVANWLHSITFPSPFRLQCMIDNNKQLKFFFRVRDEILAHCIIAAEIEDENDENEEIGVSDDE